jgi:sugar O-acyltransferase (sialic acid O-acetyltransferase NeuD family)
MKQLIIVGGGGMGRTVHCIATSSVGYGTAFEVKGFLDDNLQAMDGFEGYPPVLGTVDGYVIEENDVFVCSIGNVQTKKFVCEKLKARGASFMSLVSDSAIIRQNAKIGEGCIIGEHAIIGADAKIGDQVLVQSYAGIAHDCIIGNYVRIDTRVMFVGGTVAEDEATIYTGAIINHHVVVGKGASVGAGSFVIRNVKPGTIVAGNPARSVKYE